MHFASRETSETTDARSIGIGGDNSPSGKVVKFRVRAFHKGNAALLPRSFPSHGVDVAL